MLLLGILWEKVNLLLQPEVSLYTKFIKLYTSLPEVNFGHLSVSHEVGIDNVTINCTTTFDCSSTCYCQVQVDGKNENPEMFTNNEATVPVTGLTSNTQYSYTVSLVDRSGLPFDGACIMRRSQFTTLMEPGATTSSVSSSSSTSTIAMSTSLIIVVPSISMIPTAGPTGTSSPSINGMFYSPF